MKTQLILFLFVISPILAASQAEAYQVFGFAGDALSFACFKAKAQATDAAKIACVNAGQALGETVYSDCYASTYTEQDRRGGFEIYETTYKGYRVDLVYNCK